MPDLDSPIAVGATAEIFAWGDDRVLKLFRSGTYEGLPDQEWTNTLTAWQLGAPVPKPIELVEVNGRRGVILERIQGPTLTQCMQKHPLRLVSYARLLAHLQVSLHNIRAPGFPSLNERARQNISNSNLLSSEMKERLLAKLATLPEGDQLCHGDFHPENILITAKGPVVIDWEGCMRGDPSADVAVTRMFFHLIAIYVSGVKSWLIRPYLRIFERVYRTEYNRAAVAPARDQPAWIAVVTAMHLAEEIKQLFPRLLPIIEQGLNG
jgi:uncharacterized protein (TIGR02172 family)